MRPLRFLLLLLLARPLFALDVPPAPKRWFTDTANIVSTTDAAILDTKLKDFEQASGAQFIIYTLPTIGEDDAIEDFTIRAARQWAVGQKKYDNGLILFVFVQDRKARVEVGYGLEGTITDAVSRRVIDEQMAPHFQRGDYAAGLNAAADELIRRIRTGEKPVEPLQPRESAPQGRGGIDIGLLVFIIVFFVIFILPMLSRRRRGGGCGGCIPIFIPGGFGGGGITFGGGGFSGGGFGGGGGGFSGGGGGFGGGGATGGW